MPRLKSVVGKVLIVVLVLGAVSTLIQPVERGAGGPYSSSLSVPFFAPAYAAAYCNDKYCAGGSRHNIVCAKVVGYHCVNLSGGYCTSNGC